MNPTIQIRPIEPKDNIDLAKVIRGALEEFGANKPGTVYFDPTTDALFELFNNCFPRPVPLASLCKYNFTNSQVPSGRFSVGKIPAPPTS